MQHDQGAKYTREGADHVNAIKDLVTNIAADAHVGSPCGSIQWDIRRFILRLELGI